MFKDMYLCDIEIPCDRHVMCIEITQWSSCMYRFEIKCTGIDGCHTYFSFLSNITGDDVGINYFNFIMKSGLKIYYYQLERQDRMDNFCRVQTKDI